MPKYSAASFFWRNPDARESALAGVSSWAASLIHPLLRTLRQQRRVPPAHHAVDQLPAVAPLGAVRHGSDDVVSFCRKTSRRLRDAGFGGFGGRRNAALMSRFPRKSAILVALSCCDARDPVRS